MRTHLSERFVCGLATTALVVSMAGCKTMELSQDDQSSRSGVTAPPVQRTAAELQMDQDRDRVNKTMIGGVLTGAAVGAAIGVVTALITGKRSEAVKYGVIGGVAGGAAGGIDGYLTAKKDQSGRSEARTLQAAAADVRTDNERFQAYLDSSGTVLAEGKARLAALNDDVAAKRLTAQQADQARKREEQNIASMNTTLAQAKKTREQYQQASANLTGPAQNKRELDAEIARMSARVAKLEKNIEEYNMALQVSKA